MSNNFGQGGFAKTITNNTYIGELASKATIEIETLTKVITYLTSRVEHSDVRLDFETEPGFKKKVTERFATYEGQIRKEYGLLLPDYINKYESAWENANSSEERRDEIDSLLSLKSLRILEENKNDPIKAIDQLVAWLKKEIGNNHNGNKGGYSENAIRFFIYKEFARCYVFPNIK
jgi:hypothetical protein